MMSFRQDLHCLSVYLYGCVECETNILTTAFIYTGIVLSYKTGQIRWGKNMIIIKKNIYVSCISLHVYKHAQ